MFFADLVLAVVGLLVFPAVIVANLALPAARLAADDPRPAAARRGQRDRPRVVRRRDGRQDARPRGARRPQRFAAKAHELRDVNIRAGRIRAAFDPVLAALPSLGVLVVLAVGVVRVLTGATDAGDVVTVAYLLTIVSFPIRSIGWLLGEFPRSVVGFRAGQRGARRDRRDAVRRPRRSPAGGGGARLVRRRTSATPTTPTSGCSTTSTSTVEPGRTVAVVGATASGKSTLTTLMTRLVDPDEGRILLDGTDLRDLARGELAGVGRDRAADGVPLRRHRARQRHAGRRRLRRRRCGRRCAPPRPTASSPRCRTGSTPAWGSAAPRCPAASGSGSRWPARWCAGRGC